MKLVVGSGLKPFIPKPLLPSQTPNNLYVSSTLAQLIFKSAAGHVENYLNKYFT